MSYFDTPSSSGEGPLPMPSIEVDPPSSPKASSSLSKTSPKKKLSKKAYGKQPATYPAYDEDEDPISLKSRETVSNNTLHKANGKQKKKDQHARNANRGQGESPIQYETLLKRLEIDFGNTKKTIYSTIIDLLRSSNDSNARVNDLEVYVGTINGNGDDEDKPSGPLPSNEPRGNRYGSQQTRPNLTQRQNGYEDGQDRLGEQQDVLASQQQRLDRRLADIEYCLQLSTPTRSESAPPRPTAPTAGLFPPWSEGYWGGSKSPSRLAGAWGPRSSRSNRGAGARPGNESGSVVAGDESRPLIRPPVTGRTAVLGPTSTAPPKRKAGEVEGDDDANKGGKSKKQKKGTKNKDKSDDEKNEGNEPKPRPKIKAKPAETTQPAPKETKIPLKNRKRQVGDGDEDSEDGNNNNEEPKQKTTGTSKPRNKIAPKTLPKKRKANELEDEDDDNNDDKPEQGKARPNQKPAAASKPTAKKPKIASKAGSKTAPKSAPKTGPKAKPKAAPKSCDPKNHEDDAEDSDGEDEQGKPKPANISKPAPKSAPKTASERGRTVVSKIDDNDEELDENDEDQRPEKRKAKVAPASKKTPAKPAVEPAPKGS
ncbi:hypothetical protein LY78DRAFT_726248 [Colletotrichum sublineola]|uniref:Uncharacterized protein n=1 Tax=Colletotrichum sublineola TaxID=1173701 RepID=A0A066X868_COLSU|nr:hypothetical protein LY78DRAFT_726248 [Colletotrichum sublineola]KDN61946.1 hypothetical protein CSUB01_05167 [Colletotrichum sublineola]